MNIEEVQDSLNAFNLIQIILFYPKEEQIFKEAFSKLASLEDLDSDAAGLLSKFYQIFGSTLSLPLKELDLRKLPNLFLISGESPDNSIFIQILIELAQKHQIKLEILNYINDYFNKNKTQIDDSKVFNNLAIIATINLFYYFIPDDNIINERNIDLNKLKEGVSVFLNNKNSSSESLEVKELSSTLEWLKGLLHHPTNRNFRFKSRDICEQLKIKLDLGLMIKLCIDGVKSEKDIKNLFLVIGGSGSGKSSTINYLTGIKYELKFSRLSKIYYLNQIDNTLAPAKVGHGKSSETLYPKIINMDSFSLCDLPGLNDNRDETHKICADLALPVAFHNQYKCVKGILIIIEWESIISSKGAGLLDTFLITSSIFGLNSSIPLLFLITKTPLPVLKIYKEDNDHDDYDDLEDMVMTVNYHVRENLKILKKNQENSLTDRVKERNDLATRQDLLKQSNQILLYIKFKDFQKYRENLITLLDELPDRQELDKSLIKLQLIEEIEQKFDNCKVSDDLDTFLTHFIENILNNDENSVQRLITEEEVKIEHDLERIKDKLEKIDKDDHDNSVLIQYLEKINKDNVFIIKGHLRDRTEFHDHRDKLLSVLNNYCKHSNGLESNPIKIESKKFDKIKEWINEKCLIFNDYIDKLNLRFRYIQHREKKSKDLLKVIDITKKLLEEELLFTTEKKIMQQNKLNKINTIKQHLLFIEGQLLDRTSKIRNLNDKIQKERLRIVTIESMPEVEYGSKVLHIDNIYICQIARVVKKKYKYKFPRKQISRSRKLSDLFKSNSTTEGLILPISRVELSSCIDLESRIVFKTDVIKTDFCNLRNLNENTCIVDKNSSVKNDQYSRIAIIQPGRESYTTGDFKYNLNFNNALEKVDDKNDKELLNDTVVNRKKFINLDEGVFKVKFKLKSNKLIFGVRTFVLPKYFPKFQNEIKMCNYNIGSFERENDKLKIEIDELKQDLNKQNENLENESRDLKNDDLKTKNICDYLVKLNYNFDRFKNDLFELTEIKDSEIICRENFVEKLFYSSIDSTDKMSHEFKDEIYSRTGLKFEQIQKIVKKINKPKNKEKSLYDKLDRNNNRIKNELAELNKYKKLLEDNNDMIQVLKTVIFVLKMENLKDIKLFLNKFK